MEALKNKSLGFVFRHKLPQNSSIEELFISIMQELSRQGVPSDAIELPRSGASVTSIFKNLKFIRKRHYDIFHITGDIHYVAPFLSKKSVLTVHDIGSALSSKGIKRFIIKLLWFWIPALFVKRITVISKTSKSELEQLIPFAKEKIQVIYNPVNPKIERADKSQINPKPNILHIGTKPNKNLERTIKSLKGLNCRLTIIGKLTEKQLKLLADCEIEYFNEFHLPYEGIINHYKECDLVTFVSTYEGFGMPIIEAQKVGRPVITSNISSMPEIAGDCACLVDPYNIEEIKLAINKVLKDTEFRHRLIMSGFENVKRFEIENIAKQYIQLYSEL